MGRGVLLVFTPSQKIRETQGFDQLPLLPSLDI